MLNTKDILLNTGVSTNWQSIYSASSPFPSLFPRIKTNINDIACGGIRRNFEAIAVHLARHKAFFAYVWLECDSSAVLTCFRNDTFDTPCPI